MEKRLLKNMDYGLLTTVLVLIVVGLVTIFSATHGNKALNFGDPYYFLKRQFLWALIGMGILVGMLHLDYHSLERWHLLIYLGNLLLLLLVLAIGREVNGAKSWLYFGPVGIQVSEFVKVGVIITLAHLLATHEDIATWRGVIRALAYAGVPLFLILLQPDFGTAMVFVGIVFGMLFIAGARPSHLLILAAVGLFVVLPLGYFFFLKDYQRARLLIFLNPYQDARGDGYNIIQSMIAVGSGRLFGKGLFHGTQGQLNFLPEHHTDFIFPVFAEEMGFLGSIFLLGLYFYFLWRSVMAVVNAKESFGRLLATGVISMFLFHILINLGMTIGIMPITGIPLPFLSYGGSSLWANLIGVGLLLNIYMRRQKIIF